MGKKKIEVRGQGSEVRVKADEILGAIQVYSEGLADWQAKLEAELNIIRHKYAGDLAALEELKLAVEKELKKFALKNRVDLFGLDGDKVTLSHGTILYSKANKVTIPKDAVEKIEELGWDEGILIVKNIDRPVIEGWNDEKLAAIGASKKPKESITWEITKKAKAV